MKPNLILSIWKHAVNTECQAVAALRLTGIWYWLIYWRLEQWKRKYSLGVLESNKAVVLLSPRNLMSWKCQSPMSQHPRVNMEIRTVGWHLNTVPPYLPVTHSSDSYQTSASHIHPELTVAPIAHPPFHYSHHPYTGCLHYLPSPSCFHLTTPFLTKTHWPLSVLIVHSHGWL